MNILTRSDSWKKIGSGVNGTYYKINAYQGIKLIGYPRHGIEEMEKTNFPFLAKQELLLLHYANQKTNLTPRPYGFKYVDMGDKRVYCGILQEHCKGITLNKYSLNNIKPLLWQSQYHYPTDILDKLYNIFLKQDILNDDLNSNNVIIQLKGNIITNLKVCDWDPYFCKILGEQHEAA